MKSNSIDKKIDAQLQSAAAGIPINYDPSGWQKLSVMLDKAPAIPEKKKGYFHLNVIVVLILSGIISVALLLQNKNVTPIHEKEKKSLENVVVDSKILAQSDFKKISEKLEFLLKSSGFSGVQFEKKLVTTLPAQIEQVIPLEAPRDSTSKKENLFIFW